MEVTFNLDLEFREFGKFQFKQSIKQKPRKKVERAKYVFPTTTNQNLNNSGL